MTQETSQSAARPFAFRPLVIVAICAGVLAATALAFLLGGRAILARQKAGADREAMRAGRLLAGHLAESSAFPLLGEDAATLSRLVGVPAGDGSLLFIAVTDGDNVVRAHTDATRVGEILRVPPAAAEQANVEGVAQLTYRLPGGGRAIRFSRALVVRGKTVGFAHATFDRDALDRDAERTVAPLRRSLFGLGALSAAAVVGLAILSVLSLIGGAAPARFVAVPDPGRAERRSAYRVMAIDDPGKSPAVDESSPEAGGAETTAESAAVPQVARNQATVLVSNIRGFRAYADGRRPEEILEGLNAYFDIAEGIVATHGGRISHISGDTVVAVFGGPTFLPEHTSCAVRAALAMQSTLRMGEGGYPLLKQIAIGISSGVILSCEGGAPHRPGTVMIGESFKAADALASMAGPGEIVIGREVYQYLGNAVSVDPLPPREILDRTGSWENFRLQDDVRRRA